MEGGSRENAPGSDANIRRSGRCRTASSMYAKSIDEFKKVEVGRWQNLRKPGRSLRFAEEDSGIPSNQMRDDSCSMDLEENALACQLPEAGGQRLIWVTVVGPQKPARTNRPVEPRTTTILKKKSSAFKEPPKEVEKKQSNLLGMLLGAAIKVVHGPQEDPQQQPASEQRESSSQQPNHMDKPSEVSNGQQQKKPETRHRSKLVDRDEDLKKLSKQQAKFNSQSLRFQQLKNKLSVQT